MTDTFDPAATLEALREEAAARDAALQNVVTTYSQVHEARRALDDAVTAHQTARKDAESFGITDALLKRAHIEPIASASKAPGKAGSKTRKRPVQPKPTAAPAATPAAAQEDAPVQQQEEQLAS